MTTIKSIAETSVLTIGVTRTAPDNVDVGMGEKVGIFRRADLLAALDATANTDVKHRADAYEDATRAERQRDEWKACAAKYDDLAKDLAADLKAVAAERDHWKFRSEAAEASAAELGAKLEKVTGSADAWWSEYDAELKAHAETKARAEKAEAAVVKVMAWAHDWRDEYGREAFKELDAILDPLRPKPAFTLPTEAGAVVEYTDHGGATQRWFRTRDSQRPWVDREGNTWHDAGLERDVAGSFTVLIGAES